MGKHGKSGFFAIFRVQNAAKTEKIYANDPKMCSETSSMENLGFGKFGIGTPTGVTPSRPFYDDFPAFCTLRILSDHTLPGTPAPAIQSPTRESLLIWVSLAISNAPLTSISFALGRCAAQMRSPFKLTKRGILDGRGIWQRGVPHHLNKTDSHCQTCASIPLGRKML